MPENSQGIETKRNHYESDSQFFSAGGPIESIKHLKGRQRKLDQISRTLGSLGRQIFIFGDRGVGKTSLARTAAFRAPSYKFYPVYVGCDREGNFFQLAAAIIDELAGRMDQSIEKTVSTKRAVLAKIFCYELNDSSGRIYRKFESVSQFVQALKLTLPARSVSLDALIMRPGRFA